MEDHDDDNLEKKEYDPSEEEIRNICEEIRKNWGKKQKISRSVYKPKDFTVSIIKTTDIDMYN